MNARYLIAKIWPFISKPSNHTSYQITELEQSLKDTSELLNDRIRENSALKKERNYILDIYLHRNGCRFDMQFDDNRRMLLFTTNCEPRRKNIIIYIPSEQLKIAEINTHACHDRLIIDSIELEYVHCDAKVGKLILQKMAAQARGLCLSQVVGQFEDSPNISFSEKVQFYRSAGFEVSANIVEGTGSLLYKLESDDK